MTEEQRQWTEKKTAQLRAEIERKWPLSDQDWESLTAAVGKLIEMSKGHAAVRNELFDLIEEYDIRERKERSNIMLSSREEGHESGKRQ